MDLGGSKMDNNSNYFHLWEFFWHLIHQGKMTASVVGRTTQCYCIQFAESNNKWMTLAATKSKQIATDSNVAISW